MSALRRIPKEFGMLQLEREAAWHKVEKPVLVADIFKRVASEDKQEKNNQQEKICRVLVEGRAGVGKTTLVQFIAWQWATQGLFGDTYDYVLCVLKTMAKRSKQNNRKN